ncbi:MAG: hypothetical protein ACYC6Z_10735 [Thermoleophilia bacterium]
MRAENICKRRLPAAAMVFTFLAASALISGCAVRAREDVYGQPYTPDVSRWRQYLGAAIAIQFFLLALALWNSGHRQKISRMLLSLVLVPLLWTFPAELIYRLQVWILDWGWPGRLLAIILSFAGGLYGTSSIFTYLLGGFVFSDTRYLLYWSVPGVIAGYIVAVRFVINWRLSENRHRKDSVTMAIKHDN